MNPGARTPGCDRDCECECGVGVGVGVADEVGVEEVEVSLKGVGAEVKDLEMDVVGEEGMGRGLDRAILCIPMRETCISISI